jgi:hypothetical protein
MTRMNADESRSICPSAPICDIRGQLPLLLPRSAPLVQAAIGEPGGFVFRFGFRGSDFGF